jgi:UDP-N-acetylglucosamine acyltransferase
MSTIDPTARVDSHAELGADVVVGPWCQVGPNVRLGDGTILDSMNVVDGHTEIGPRCHLYHGAVVGTPPQDLKYDGAPTRCRVGSDSIFREYSTVHRSTAVDDPTSVGSHCLVMAYAHVAHNCHLGDRVILSNSANLAGHVEIDDWAIVGGVTPVHQFVKIGAHSIIGGGCRVPMDIVPYVIAAGTPDIHIYGLNRIGLQRRGFSEETIRVLDRLYRIFFRSGLRVDDAVARIRSDLPALPEVEEFLRFVERSNRGLARPRTGGKH